MMVTFLLLMMGGGRLCDILTGLVHSGPGRMTGLAEVTWRRRIILGVSQATDCFRSARDIQPDPSRPQD